MDNLLTEKLNKNKDRWISAGICLFASILYIGFLSNHYDVNGIVEVELVERGQVTPRFFTPNHLLYLSIGHFFYKLWLFFGYTGRALLPLQVLTALFGALGVGVFFWALRKLTGARLISLLVSLAFAVSYGFWVTSTDAYYVMLATFFVILSLVFFLNAREDTSNQRRRLTYCALLGLTSGLSILFFQANLFFIPAIMVDMLFIRRNESLRVKWSGLSVFLLSLVLTVGIPYLIVGVVVAGARSLTDLILWTISYGGGSGYSPIYGVVDAGRIWNSLVALVGTLAPVRPGLGLRNLLQGQIAPEKLIPQLSLGLTIVIALLSAVYLARYRRELAQRHNWLFIFALVCFVPFLLFNTWWDPDETWVWLTPVLPLWMVWAALLTDATERLSPRLSRYSAGFVGVFVTILFLANFTAAIIPRRFSPNENLEKALFAGAQMQANDVLVTMSWDWAGYLPYFTQRDRLDLTAVFAQEGSRAGVLARLGQIIADRRNDGGRVFLVDVLNYPDDWWQWITQNTGLTREDIAGYERQPAWTYLGETVWEIVDADAAD